MLWRMKWGGFKISVFDALMMNGASFLGLLLGLGPFIQTTGIWGDSLFFTYSAVVEGFVLMALERHNARKAWTCAIAANALSTVMLMVETLCAQLKVPVFPH